MPTGREDILQQLEASVKDGNELFNKLTGKPDLIEFGTEYQRWYTRTLPLVRTLAPDRFGEFRAYYEVDPKRKEVGSVSYVLQDYVNLIAPKPII